MTSSDNKYCPGCGEGQPGFVIEGRDDAVYDRAAVPCPVCNPNPPVFEQRRIKKDKPEVEEEPINERSYPY